MKKFFVLILLMSLVSGMAVTPGESAADEPIRMGVLRFISRANGVSNQQAEAITDIFARILSGSRSIALIERERLSEIGREHKLNMSGMVDAGTAIKVGALAGCQYMLLGAVTQFDKSEKTESFGQLFSETRRNAQVTIDMRVVDVATGEVILSLAERGEASQKDTNINIVVDQKTREMDDLTGQAIADAASKLGRKIRETVAGEYIQVLIAGGREVTINAGATSGVKKGDHYLVYMDGAEITDIDGTVLDRRSHNLAAIRVAEVRSDISTAHVVGGEASIIRRGDKLNAISGGEAKDMAKRKAFVKRRPMTGDIENVDERLGAIAQETQGAGTAAVSAISEPSAPKEPVGGSAPSAGKGIIPPSRPLENKSTDPGKVIATYGLPSGEANTRRIAHLNAGRLNDKQQAYDKYVELADSYKGDYLAAYRAGLAARDMGKKDDAASWFDKALSINPNYEPAKEAKSGMKDSPAPKKKKGR
ncbi:MAG: hypothetical protein IJR68_03050 [Fretibacterium sp.]|nr:hypothetical protein [Fretibacterium sp.]